MVACATTGDAMSDGRRRLAAVATIVTTLPVAGEGDSARATADDLAALISNSTALATAGGVEAMLETILGGDVTVAAVSVTSADYTGGNDGGGDDDDDDDDDGARGRDVLSTPAIVGITVGSFLCVVLTFVPVYLVLSARRRLFYA